MWRQPTEPVGRKPVTLDSNKRKWPSIDFNKPDVIRLPDRLPEVDEVAGGDELCGGDQVPE